MGNTESEELWRPKITMMNRHIPLEYTVFLRQLAFLILIREASGYMCNALRHFRSHLHAIFVLFSVTATGSVIPSSAMTFRWIVLERPKRLLK